MPNRPANDSSTDTVDFLKSARDIAFLFAVFLYFMGWIYIYYFLSGFGLSIKAIDVDIYNLMIYSSNIFIYIFNYHPVITALIIAGIVLVSRWKPMVALFSKFYPLFIAALFPLCFVVARSAGEAAAQLILDSPRTTLKQISFVFKDEPLKPLSGDSLAKNNDDVKNLVISQSQTGNFRLLVSNKDEYYVLQCSQHYHAGSPAIYIIKKELIESAKISN